MTPRFGYVVAWVPDVAATVAFYEQAFGLPRRSVRTFGTTTWAEMETGGTTLAFASETEAEQLFADGFRSNRAEQPPSALLMSLVVDDVEATYKTALAAGAVGRDAPKREPWGQTVARMRDINGLLVSLASLPPSSPQE